MKIPNRLVGFVEFDFIKFPFEFCKNTFRVYIYPPNQEVWEKYSSYKEIFKSTTNFDPKEHKWISELKLFGKTANHKKNYF